MAAVFTYVEVGATSDSDALPSGYRHLRLRRRVGHGQRSFAAVADAVLTWNVHRRAGLRVTTSALRAAEGVDVTARVGLGPLGLRVPCRVVWAFHDARRAGFAYGTLPGHPESGEESFVVELDDHDDVWFTVVAFSRPARWYAKLGGPLTRLAQDVATRRYVAAARKAATAAA